MRTSSFGRGLHKGVLCGLVLATSLFFTERAGSQEIGNLLRSEHAVFEGSPDQQAGMADAGELLDGNPETTVAFASVDQEPVDLLFAFGNEGVGLQEIILSFARGNERAPAGFDVLVSQISPSAGFTSVKSERLDPLKSEQSFKFPPVAAKWLMIRLFPGTGAQSIVLADLAAHGTLGPPETRYAFGETPAKALDIIEGLAEIGGARLALTDEERSIFGRVTNGDLTQTDFEEIALLASGVTDRGQRVSFMAELDRLEARLRQEIDLETGAYEVGQNLLFWLHDNVMTGGYQERQTDLSGVLQDAIFNCVSSAVIYNALGQRLGLDLRAIEVPDHAFSILYDGTNHADIETTTRHGFNPRREQIADFAALTGFEYIPESNRSKRREIGRAGLAALIYYNHGVEHIRAGRYQDALLANFRAMSLDPEFASAATNAIAALGKWGKQLSDGEDWERAVQIAALGRQLAPNDLGLARNEKAIWQNWAMDLSEGGDFDAALRVLDDADETVPGEDFTEMRAGLFIHRAETRIDAGQWDEAFDLAALGMGRLDGAALQSLSEWRESLFLRKANAAIGQAAFEDGAAALLAGLTAYPDSSKVRRSVRYLAQEWAAAAGDYASGLDALANVAAQFPSVDGLGKVASAYVGRQIGTAVREARPLNVALSMAEKARSELAFVDAGDLALSSVYGQYGSARIDQEDWPGAAEVFSLGLAAHPDDRRLKQNARYVAQEWQREALAEAGAEGLAAVNAKLRALFPSFAVDPGFGANEIRRQIQVLVDQSDYVGATEFLDSAQLVIGAETYREIWIYLFDHQARRAMDNRDWKSAAEVYAQGRTDLGDTSLFARNIGYIAQEWTRDAGQTAGAQGVADVLEVLVAIFPGESSVAEMGMRALQRLVLDLVDSGQIDDAKQQIVLARRFLGESEVTELTVLLYQGLGNARLDLRDWKGALIAYTDGLSILGDVRDLRRNIPYAFQEWSAEALAEGGGPRFKAAADEMKALFPDDRKLDDVLGNVLSRHAQALVDEGAPGSALELLNDLAETLNESEIRKAKESVYERWARQYFDASGWATAAEIYQSGLDDLGTSSLLENNLKYAQSKMK